MLKQSLITVEAAPGDPHENAVSGIMDSAMQAPLPEPVMVYSPDA